MTLTGGNPFFLRELARSAARRRPPRAAVLDAAPRRRRRVGSGAARAAFRPLRNGLSGAAAILGEGALIRHAAALADLDDREAAEAADALRAGPDPDRAPASCGSCTRSSAARSHEQLSPAARSAAHGARGADARRGGRPRRARGRASARDRAARLGVGVRSAPRRRARGRPARCAGRLGHVPASGARGATVAGQRGRPCCWSSGVAESLTLDRAVRPIEHLRRGVETTADTRRAALRGADAWRPWSG